MWGAVREEVDRALKVLTGASLRKGFFISSMGVVSDPSFCGELGGGGGRRELKPWPFGPRLPLNLVGDDDERPVRRGFAAAGRPTEPAHQVRRGQKP